MLKDIKLGFKMTKFGINYKLMLILSILFIIMGIAIQFMPYSNENRPGILGDIYLVIVPSFFIQIIMPAMISGNVLASSKMKRVSINVPVAINGLGTFLAITISTVIKCLLRFLGNGENNVSDNLFVCSAILVGVFSLFMQIYNITVYRYYWQSCIVYFILFIPMYLGFNKIVENFSINIPIVTAIVVEYLLCFMGVVLSYKIAKACYKKTLNSWYVRRTIQYINKK